MRKSVCLKLFGLFLVLATLKSCIYHRYDDESPNRYSSYEPIYMNRSTLENSIKLSQPRAMHKAGKIYVKDQFIFITDENKGFHIYNNSNPSNPSLVAFLEVPGATDMAIKNNSIYINQARDLVAISITDNNVTVHKRIPETFPSKVSPDGYVFPNGADEIIVDWKLR